MTMIFHELECIFSHTHMEQELTIQQSEKYFKVCMWAQK